MASQTLTTAAVAKVNLLPPEIAERVKVRKVQVGLACAVAAAAAAVGLLYVQQLTAVSSAKQDVASAERTQTQLRGDLAEYQNVRDVYARVEARQALLTQAMGEEIRWSRYFNDLSVDMPANVWLTRLEATQQVAGSQAASAATTSGQVLTTGLGTVTIEGRAFTHDDVAFWLERLARQKGYVDSFFTRSELDETAGRELYEFESQVTLTKDALSGRYTKKLQAGS